ncbi:hypothetical protein [Parabacteroides sp.]
MKQYCFYQNYSEVCLLVIHCSATRYDRDFPVEALCASHKARILGHYQLSPYIKKACPCFDAEKEYGEI